MLTRKDIKKLFYLAEIEEKEEQLRQKALRKEKVKVKQKLMMIEYLIEHLNPRALIAVHQTDYFPEGGILRPSGHYLFNFFGSKNAKKIIEDLQLKHPRITIHFTLNYPVRGVVAGGQWVEWKGKYAILIPVVHFINRIKCLNPVDTWIIGALKLPPSAEIVMRENEYFKNQAVWDKLAGGAKIIPFSRKNTIHKAIEIRIRKKGYRLMEGGDFDWYQEQEMQKIAKFIEESVILSEEEKQRLINLCTTKGYKVWIHIFEELAEKLKKEVVPHKITDLRQFERWLGRLYAMMFNPSNYQLRQPANDVRFELMASSGGAETYKVKMKELSETGEHNLPHEKQYLGLLIGLLGRLEEWLKDVYGKFRSTPDIENITWGDFLKRQKII